MFGEVAVDVWTDRADLFAKENFDTRIGSTRRLRQQNSGT
jgi:hypothetical protein